ncbi:formyltransferase family protein [Pseudooceanicola sp.]|uniref:formyltransferase family protein n=1 Tax=Pseudooceanicola sp. TaxID=1914328 RepID=UPI0035C702C3
MTQAPDWWARPRDTCILVDNESWVLPHAEALLRDIRAAGDRCELVRRSEDVPSGVVAFLLGCTQITPREVLGRNRYNLVVHESDLPKGRGFAPMSWAVLEGASEITVCLVEAVEDVDAGDIFGRTTISLNGIELCAELRCLQGEATLKLCQEFLSSPVPPAATPQLGSPSWYKRRRPADSRLDPEQSLAAQFDLLRIVDNERYPAFFDFRGRRYRLRIDDMGPAGGISDDE